VLEVGLYGLVRHTGTSSLTGFKPYHHFFLMTVIRRNSFVVTKRIFRAQNITYAFAYSVHEPPSWLRGSSMRGAMKGEGRGIGPYRYFFFSTLSGGWGYGLVVVVPGDMSEGGGLCLIHTGS